MTESHTIEKRTLSSFKDKLVFVVDIDFVITWVDDSDPLWLEERSRYRHCDSGVDSGEERFRDWGSLRYWFRAVEENAPWVRNVYFITYGHLPNWLNTNHPKLKIVKHEDFIPKEYLPVFSVNPIEMNFHRIAGLSDRFVFFNDDTFVGCPTDERVFFEGGLPRDIAALNVHCYTLSDVTRMFAIRDAGIINEYFDMKEVIKANRKSWYNPKYGLRLLMQTYILSRAPRFPGFYTQHCAQPLLKSTYREVWDRETAILESTCSHRFRDEGDVNQWLLKEWQLVSNNFVPTSRRNYAYFHMGGESALSNARKAANCIVEKRTPYLCINDAKGMDVQTFNMCVSIVQEAFEKAYPKPSRYEVEAVGGGPQA